MDFIKHTTFFMSNNFIQIGRKWRSLPFLLIFPLLMITLIMFIILALFIPDKNEPIQIGIVDLDQSAETQVITNLISQSAELGNFINFRYLSESEAKGEIENNQISTYIIFSKDFTERLYAGKSTVLSITGNPKRPAESYLIKELIESITRHISAAQASILTINHYAKALEMSYENRQEMLFEQFTNFLLFTIGKDKIINSKILSSYTTASPVLYYVLSSWFIAVIVWILLFYNLLYHETTKQIKQRMRIYGVTELELVSARFFVTLLIITPIAIGSCLILQSTLALELFSGDYIRISLTLLLHSIIFLECLMIIDIIIFSQKIRLLIQGVLTFILIILSGAIIPTSYFPIYTQKILPYIFSHHSFYWLQELILNNRLYVDVMPLLIMAFTGYLLLIGCSFAKERVKS